MTSDIILVLAHRPLPAFREFLIQLPIILRSLTLNSIGRDAVLTSGVLERYVETLVSKEYLAVMRSRRTRDPPTYSQGNLNGLGFNQNSPTGALAVQMAQNLQDLVRSHSEFRTIVFDAILQVRFVLMVSTAKVYFHKDNLLFLSSSGFQQDFRAWQTPSQASSRFGIFHWWRWFEDVYDGFKWHTWWCEDGIFQRKWIGPSSPSS